MALADRIAAQHRRRRVTHAPAGRDRAQLAARRAAPALGARFCARLWLSLFQLLCLPVLVHCRGLALAGPERPPGRCRGDRAGRLDLRLGDLLAGQGDLWDQRGAGRGGGVHVCALPVLRQRVPGQPGRDVGPGAPPLGAVGGAARRFGAAETALGGGRVPGPGLCRVDLYPQCLCSDQLARPGAVPAAALVDRGHRDAPARAMESAATTARRRGPAAAGGRDRPGPGPERLFLAAGLWRARVDALFHRAGRLPHLFPRPGRAVGLAAAGGHGAVELLPAAQFEWGDVGVDRGWGGHRCRPAAAAGMETRRTWRWGAAGMETRPTGGGVLRRGVGWGGILDPARVRSAVAHGAPARVCPHPLAVPGHCLAGRQRGRRGDHRPASRAVRAQPAVPGRRRAPLPFTGAARHVRGYRAGGRRRRALDLCHARRAAHQIWGGRDRRLGVQQQADRHHGQERVPAHLVLPPAAGAGRPGPAHRGGPDHRPAGRVVAARGGQGDLGRLWPDARRAGDRHAARVSRPVQAALLSRLAGDHRRAGCGADRHRALWAARL